MFENIDLELYIYLALGALLLLFFGPILFYGFLRLILSPIANKNRKRNKENEDNIMLQIRVSKSNEKGPLLAEQMFNTLHGMQKKEGFMAWVRGEDQIKISFEIANVRNSIRFFVYLPRNMARFVEGQLYSQYPNIEISEVEDYAKVEQSDGGEVEHVKNAVFAEMKMFHHSLFPIRRYADFEDKFTKEAIDPMGGITATMHKLNNKDDQAWVQVVANPASDQWQKNEKKVFKLYQDGYFLWPKSSYNWIHDRLMSRDKLFLFCFGPILSLLKLGQRMLTIRKAPSKDEDAPKTKDIEIIESTTNEKYWDLPTRKLAKNGFDIQIRIGYIPSDGNASMAMAKIQEIATSFMSFNLPNINGFKIARARYGMNGLMSYRERRNTESYTVNVEELATIWHLPNKNVETPTIWWVNNRKLEAPQGLPNHENTNGEFTSIGETNYRGAQDEFGIKVKDRRRHIYIIGKTGMGKSTLLENMLFSDVNAGKGVAVIDPHGDLAETILAHTPSHRTNDVIYFDPSDMDYPVGFNMLECPNPALHSIVASGLIGIFKKMFADSWGPRLEYILRNTVLSLLWHPDASMLGIMRMLVDPKYRDEVVSHVQDPTLKNFWLTEFNVMPDKQRVEVVSPIQNKIGQFLASPLMRNIIGQSKSSVDIRYAMDNKKIFLCNLSKGKIGEDNSAMLGSMMVTKFQLEAMGRANVPADDRVDFYLYVDEFQNFATDSFATILSEARKYKLNLTMANQYIAQMPDEVKDAVFGNVGSIVSFQVGYDDADYLSEQFGGEDVMQPVDLTTLPVGQVYLRLLVDNMPTPTFSARTYPPTEMKIDPERVAKIIDISRKRYTNPRKVVEDKINRWGQIDEKEMIKAAEAANKNPWDKPDIPWRNEKNREEFLKVCKKVFKKSRILDRSEYEDYGVEKDTNDVVYMLPLTNDKSIIIISTVDAQGGIFFKKLAKKMEAFEWDNKTKEKKELKFKIFKDEEWMRRVEEALRKIVPEELQEPKEEEPVEGENTEDKKEENKGEENKDLENNPQK